MLPETYSKIRSELCQNLARETVSMNYVNFTRKTSVSSETQLRKRDNQQYHRERNSHFPLKILSFLRTFSRLRYLLCTTSSFHFIRSRTRHGWWKHKHRTEPPKQERLRKPTLRSPPLNSQSLTNALSIIPGLYCAVRLAHTRLSTRGRDDAQKSKPCLMVAPKHPSLLNPSLVSRKYAPESHFHWIFTSYFSFRLLQPPCYFASPC